MLDQSGMKARKQILRRARDHSKTPVMNLSTASPTPATAQAGQPQHHRAPQPQHRKGQTIVTRRETDTRSAQGTYLLAAAVGNRAARACRAGRRGAEHGTADGNHGARPLRAAAAKHRAATAAGGLTGSTRILPGGAAQVVWPTSMR
jgi:hypothetical protein